MDEWKTINRGLTAVKTYIHATLDPTNHTYIRRCGSASEMVDELKSKFALNTAQEKRYLVDKHRSLLQPKKASTKPADWARIWKELVNDIRAAKVMELFGDDESLTRDFINSVSVISPDFYRMWSNRISEFDISSDMKTGIKPIAAIPTIDTILHFFVNWNHGETTVQRRDTPAFGTFMDKSDGRDLKGNDSESKKPTRDQSRSKDRRVICICGESHLFPLCPYVDESKKPKDFKEEPEIRKKFDNIVKRDTPFAKILKKAIKNAEANKDKKGKVDAEEKENNKEGSTTNFLYDSDEFSYSIAEPAKELTMTIGTNNMKKMTLLDGGSGRHIFNDANRFITMEPMPEPRRVLHGDSESWITQKGTVILYPTEPLHPQAKKGIVLKDVWYWPGCHTNLVSQGILRDHESTYNGERDTIVRKGKDIFRVKYDGPSRLHFIEWDKGNINKEDSHAMATSSKDIRTLSDPMEVWHKRFGHLADEAVRKLQDTTIGANVLPPISPKRNEDGFQNRCHGCLLNKAKRQVSRVEIPKSIRPFERIFVDLIIMSLARNRDTVAIHIVDHYSKFHILTTTNTKSMDGEFVRIINWIEHKFKITVDQIHKDGESALKSDWFDNWVKENHKTIKTTVPYTPEQNGPAERAGGTIVMRARTLLNEADLPSGFWPEAMKASVYILNRTPTEKIGWKTPYETIFGTKPYVGNIFRFGSKAYVRIEGIKKSHKMAPRAQIGYLLGYRAHNIWEVWVPGTKDPILVRDVVFDETGNYDPSKPHNLEIISEDGSKEERGVNIQNLASLGDRDQVFGAVDLNHNLLPYAEVEITPQTSNEPPQASNDTGGVGNAATALQQQDIVDAPVSNKNPPISEGFGRVVEDNMEIDEEANEAVDEMDIIEDVPETAITINPGQNPQIDQSEPAEPQTPDNVIRQEDSEPTPNRSLRDFDSPHTLQIESDKSDQNNQKLIEYEPQEGIEEHVQRITPRYDVNADLSQDNVVEGPRRRVPSKRALGSPEPRTAYKRNRVNFVLRKFDIEEPLIRSFMAATIQNKKRLISDMPPEPRFWRDMINHPCAEEFIKAASTEYSNLKDLGTFELVPISAAAGKQILSTTWRFTYKRNEANEIVKFKARLCVRGDLQWPNELEKRSTTLAARVFRMMMALAATFDLEIVQYDVTNAFVQGRLDEEIYIYMPDGFRSKGTILKLLRPLYGLRRSGRLWQMDLSSNLTRWGFTKINEEECLFLSKGIILMFFVDDILVIYDRKHENNFLSFERNFLTTYKARKMKDSEWFLAIRITRDREARKMWLSQESYWDMLAKQYDLVDPKVKTPLSVDKLIPYEGKATPREIHEYQKLMGSVLYPTIMTRPDLAKHASRLSEFTKNPSPIHREQIERVVSYGYNTRYLAIEYAAPRKDDKEVFIIASDAAFGDNADRTSSDGYVVKLYGGAIDWRAAKQRLVTTSTTEAELRSATEAAKRLMVWKRLFKSIGFDPKQAMSIACDNRQTVRLLTHEEPQFHTNLRHIDIYHHWLRQEIAAGRMAIHWVSTNDMAADGLTKLLSGQKMKAFIQHLGLRNIDSLLQA
jgi:hypothetical protein